MLVVIRKNTKGKAIFGQLFHNGHLVCNTLENVDKVIPAGVYNLAVTQSTKFKREMPLIWNKANPSTRGLRIHAGNYPEDSLGCILVGKSCEKGLEFGSRKYEDMLTGLCKLYNESILVVTEDK